MDADKIYDIVKQACGDLDAIYEDYITWLVGVEGLYVLKKHKRVETCGIVNGRQLYTLLPKTAVSLKGGMTDA